MTTKEVVTEGEDLSFRCCVDVAPGTGEHLVMWSLDGEVNFHHHSIDSGIRKYTDNAATICSSLSFESRQYNNNQLLKCWLVNKLNLSASFILNALCKL